VNLELGRKSAFSSETAKNDTTFLLVPETATFTIYIQVFLNWGAELTDVSVLRKLINVEVLSLSVNCIITLADIQNCKNLQELYIRKNKIPDLNEVCWLRDLTKLKNLWLEENPCCNAQQSDLYRATVIRNLPQLQKLDNVVVQPDEVSDAMRRGTELIHPYDQDESIPYTNYAPPGTQSYQQPATQPHQVQTASSRRSSQIVEQNSTYNHDDRRNSQYEQQYSCPSRRVSNQVFDPPYGHHQDTQSQATQPTHHEASAPPNSQCDASQSGYGQMVRGSSVNYGMDDGYVPDYHTGRRFSSQYQQQQYEQASQGQSSVTTRRASKVSQHSTSMDEQSMRRMSIHEGNYEDERNANSYNVSPTSRSNSSVTPQDHQPTAYHSSTHHQELLPRNAYARSNMSIEDSGDPRSIVAAHYEQTYEQVDQQIASAKQLLEERRMRSQVSPERPYPRRPKNRNSNILSAVLCLIKELDAPSLEVAEMAIRCRMEELDD